MTAESRTENQVGETNNPSDFAARAAIVIEFLESVREDRAQLAALGEDVCARLLLAAGQVARPDPWAKRELLRAAQKRRREEQRARDEAALARTGIREKRREQVFLTPLPASDAMTAADIDRSFAPEPGEEQAPHAAPRVSEPRPCYVCKGRFQTLHPFYDSMCSACGDFNFQKRSQTADLTGRVALITGSRVKIGYQAGIMLLRAGAHVIVTTRFPRDAAARYANEPDFDAWGHRLEVHGLDLRHTPSVETFASELKKRHTRLDFMIHNACQTVRRPSGFYGHLMARETEPHHALAPRAQRLLEAYEHTRRGEHAATLSAGSQTLFSPATQRAVGLHDAAALSQLALLPEDLERGAHIFPTGQLDADLQQVDLRGRNSWRLPLAEVSTVELLEVQLVNAVAPFVLSARLKPLMMNNPRRDGHIVNVSAMEGQFYRTFKTDKHPHTNMAKAALNMLTRTSAADYVKDGIHMNSVDTGWVTDEDVADIAARKTREQGFHPPLDIVDGAARICDPIFRGINTGEHAWGVFFKDYAPTHW